MSNDRQQRRANERLLMRKLRQDGCRCIPTIHRGAPAPPPPMPGVTWGGWVEHQEDCPLGRRLVKLNKLGQYPPS
jgi:hypothetical protein